MGYVLAQKACLAPDDDVILIHDVYSSISSNVPHAVRLTASGVPTVTLAEPPEKH